MANRLWMHDTMTAGMEPEKISGSGSGHGLQSQELNIGSQVDNSDSRSKKRKWQNDLESNAAKANEERPEEVGAVVTPMPGRGRPKGSKNKPKDPALSGISKGSKNKPKDPALSGTSKISEKLKCCALEIPDGNDVSKTLETFARRSEAGVFILSGTGMVSNVTLRHPAVPAGMRTYAGPLRIISLAGAFPHGTQNQVATGITVSLVDERSGAIAAGSVVGNLVAVGRVSVYVAAGTVVDIHCERPNVQPMPVQLMPVQPIPNVQPMPVQLMPVQPIPNVQPMPVQPCGLFLQNNECSQPVQHMAVQQCGMFQSSDLTEVQRQINMISEIRSLSANSLSANCLVTRPSEHSPIGW